MRFNNFGNTSASGVDFASGERQAALRAMHRMKVRPASAVSSGWGTDVAGNDRRSVHAALNGTGDLRGAWWSFYCRVYTALIPGADLERAMYSFHRMHHSVTIGWLSYMASIGKTTEDIKAQGLISAVQAAVLEASHSDR